MITLNLSEAAEHAALARKAAALEAQINTQRSYQAAQINRLTNDWIHAHTATRSDLRLHLRTLRARSRDLAKNDPFFKKFLTMCKTNVVGAHGIRLQVRVKQGNQLAQELNQRVEAAFTQWGKKETCSASGKLSWEDAQRLFIRTLARDGEVLVRKHWVRKTKANPFGFTLQFIDVSWLDETHNGQLANGNRVLMGIEVDKLDKPVAYHLTPPAEETVFPGAMATGDNARNRVRVPAAEIIHAYLTDDENQTRGVPWAHATMLRVKMLNGYEEAELVAARTGACKGGFLKPPEDQQYSGDRAAPVIESVEPGMVQELPPGYEWIGYDPNHPNANYPAYVQNVLLGIAAGLGVSYTSLTGDLSKVNFSSIRAGLLDERDVWRELQQFVITHFCAAVFAAWLDAAWLSGTLPLSVAEYDDVALHAYWQPRGWAWVDPLRDVQASVLAIQNGLGTRTDALASQGEDFAEIVQVLAQEHELLEQAGLLLAPPATTQPANEPAEKADAPDSPDS